jgi:hypothetical protein
MCKSLNRHSYITNYPDMSWTDQRIEPESEKRETLLQKLAQCESSENIYDYTQAILPNWILHTCRQYVNEYELLQKNWEQLCNQWNTTPKRILIVSFLPSREEFEKLSPSNSSTNIDTFQIIATCCNKLTAHGFVVRAYTELTACKRCEQAMLSERVYTYLREHKSPLAQVSEWSNICRSCGS